MVRSLAGAWADPGSIPNQGNFLGCADHCDPQYMRDMHALFLSLRNTCLFAWQPATVLSEKDCPRQSDVTIKGCQQRCTGLVEHLLFARVHIRRNNTPPLSLPVQGCFDLLLQTGTIVQPRPAATSAAAAAAARGGGGDGLRRDRPVLLVGPPGSGRTTASKPSRPDP